jgi:hypothetical protein
MAQKLGAMISTCVTSKSPNVLPSNSSSHARSNQNQPSHQNQQQQNQQQLHRQFPFSLFDATTACLAGSDDVDWCVSRVVDRFRAGFNGCCLVPVVAEVAEFEQLTGVMNFLASL